MVSFHPHNGFLTRRATSAGAASGQPGAGAGDSEAALLKDLRSLISETGQIGVDADETQVDEIEAICGKVRLFCEERSREERR